MAGCARPLELDAVRASIQERLEELLDAPIAGVTCPDRRKAVADDTFECTAAGRHGATLRIRVTQMDDRGNVDWEVIDSKGFLSIEALVVHIQDNIKTQVGIDVKAYCGWLTLREAVAGESFECEAADADGVTRMVLVTMTDDKGGATWELIEP